MFIPVRVIAERRVAEHFIALDAVSAERAIDFHPERFSRARALARLRDVGVVQGGDGALYLDRAAWDDRRGTRRKRALALLALGAVSAGIAAVASRR